MQQSQAWKELTRRDYGGCTLLVLSCRNLFKATRVNVCKIYKLHWSVTDGGVGHNRALKEVSVAPKRRQSRENWSYFSKDFGLSLFVSKQLQHFQRHDAPCDCLVSLKFSGDPCCVSHQIAPADSQACAVATHGAKSELTIWLVDDPNPTFTLWSAIYMHTCILHILWSDLIMQSKQIWRRSLFLGLPTVCACVRAFTCTPVHKGTGAGQAFRWSKREAHWRESFIAASYCEGATEIHSPISQKGFIINVFYLSIWCLFSRDSAYNSATWEGTYSRILELQTL